MRTRIVAAFIAAIGCAGFAGSANAQTLAVKVGVNVSTMTQDATARPDDKLAAGGGLMVGVQIRRRVNHVFQLQIEGLFIQKGNVLRNAVDRTDDTIVTSYLEVPVLARVDIMKRGSKTVSIHGGPTLALRAGTGEKNNSLIVEPPLQLKAFDLGLAVGVQVELRKFIIGARYTLGLSNIFADDPAVFGFSRMKNRAFTLFAGWGLR